MNHTILHKLIAQDEQDGALRIDPRKGGISYAENVPSDEPRCASNLLWSHTHEMLVLVCMYYARPYVK